LKLSYPVSLVCRNSKLDVKRSGLFALLVEMWLYKRIRKKAKDGLQVFVSNVADPPLRFVSFSNDSLIIERLFRRSSLQVMLS